MKHSIIFKNSDNHWDNGLPLGNGCFGTMVYFEKGKLYMPMNHYEVYYNHQENALPADQLAAAEFCDDPGALERRFTARADSNQAPKGESFATYRSPRDRINEKETTAVSFYRSHPKTGDMIFSFGDRLKDADEKLALYIEDAKSVLTLEGADCKLELETVISREDCIINSVSQSEEGLLSCVQLAIQPQRGAEMPDIEFKQIDKSTLSWTVTRKLGAKTFVFSGIIRLVGAEGELVRGKYSVGIKLTRAEKKFYILTGIFTEFKYKDTLGEGLAVMDGWEGGISKLLLEHNEYWSEFFGRSSIDIPDKFIEHVYYINQYALDCSSGKDGVMKHEACGLNGLWDVRQPTLWGSVWYWDVNIQAAFAGVFSSNRLDLAKVFSDGLLTYVGLAKKAAHDIHDMTGIAGDYPVNFYYSTWPWCAQYLWFLYEYSLDKEYLEKDAYPLFLGLCEFYCQLFKYNEKLGYYSVYPDVSPEQGALSRDTVSTVSAVKYLFKFTLEAAELLGKEESPLLNKVREIMNNMAPYAVSGAGTYGVHLKDAADVPDNVWLRHPSMLMPVFPIGEFEFDKDEEMRKIISNTVDFIEDYCEIGIFGGCWIAAAAARVGRGQTALRLIYERGLDHMLRTNGLTAEKTDRFTNYCLTIRQPLYYPCMAEFTGEMPAALNEMLINSDNGLIKVFPAIPDGDPEYGRLIRHGVPHQDYHDVCATYDAWRDVRFEKLLCKGAFEVSAALKDGNLDFIKVHSKKGGKVRLTSPFICEGLSVYGEKGVIEAIFHGKIFEFDTEAGETYVISKNADVDTSAAELGEYEEEIRSHLTYTKRMIYLGEDKEAKYRTAVDGVMRDWYLGNVRMENQTMYKFDFTNNTEKIYSDCLPRQVRCGEGLPLKHMGFFKIGDENIDFTDVQGYGFVGKASIVERSGPDLLRRDFVSGTSDAEFVIDAPRGQYELFVVSGDDVEDSVTILEGVNWLAPRCTLTKKGEYQCKLIPIINEDDEPIRLKISTLPGYSWKINFMVLNGVKGYN